MVVEPVRGKKGRAPSTSKPITIKDVANKAGVAHGTVSRILNGFSNVDPALRDRVQKVIDELGFRRNAAARSMRLGKTLAIGCIVSDIRQEVAAMMLTGAEAVFRDAGYAMIVAASHHNERVESEILAFMQDRAVDGLLMIVSRDGDPATRRRLKALNCPLVLWERDAGSAFDSVVTEHRTGVRSATEHLFALGHRDIVLMAGTPDTWVGREQLLGFKEAFAHAGLDCPRDRIFSVGGVSPTELQAMLVGKDRPTAFITNINEVADVLATCVDLRISVPRDLSVISIGDSKYLTLTTPQITSASGEPEMVGQQAAELLLKRLTITVDGRAERISVPTRLIVRTSTGPAATAFAR